METKKRKILLKSLAVLSVAGILGSSVSALEGDTFAEADSNHARASAQGYNPGYSVEISYSSHSDHSSDSISYGYLSETIYASETAWSSRAEAWADGEQTKLAYWVR